jgi:4-diphosphocytidyl-2-C-methyl-D-erythritol kinase
VLVNPLVSVSTPQVFQAFKGPFDAPLKMAAAPEDMGTLMQWLGSMHNALQRPACMIAPEIEAVLALLASQPGCVFSRMSGSGATCFGLFARAEDAAHAAETLAARENWWVKHTVIGEVA